MTHSGEIGVTNSVIEKRIYGGESTRESWGYLHVLVAVHPAGRMAGADLEIGLAGSLWV
jgi:hypothetical protein